MSTPIIDNESREMLELVDAFEACTIPRERWNHRAHLVYALVMLSRHGAALGAFAIRDGILRYADVQRIEQTPTGGFHETLTRFYIWLVQRFLERADRTAALSQLLDELLREHGDKDLPYRYYSRERLNSWEARTRWLEPDLRPLEKHG